MFKYFKFFQKSELTSIGLQYVGNNQMPFFHNFTFQRHIKSIAPCHTNETSINRSSNKSPGSFHSRFRNNNTKSETQYYQDILAECGINRIVSRKKCISILNSSVSELKSSGILSNNANVPETLLKTFNDVQLPIEMDLFNDSMQIDSIRANIIKIYLKHNLGIKDDEYERLMEHNYAKISIMPFRMLKTIYETLTIEYKLNALQIKENIGLLNANLRDLTDVTKFQKSILPTILSRSFKESQPWTMIAMKDYKYNYSEILSECGLANERCVSRKQLANILYSPVGILKKMGYIPMDVNVPQRLSEQFKHVTLPLEKQHFDESMPLGTIRYIILKLYLKSELGYTEEKFHNLIHHYILCKPFSHYRKLNKILNANSRAIRIVEPWLPFKKHVINNRYYNDILDECGLVHDSPTVYKQYIQIMKKTVKRLKYEGYLPVDTNVAQHLVKLTGMHLPIENYTLNDSVRLGTIRYYILKMFINSLVGINDMKHDRLLMESCRPILVRSFRQIRQVYDCLIDEFGFKQEELRQKLYLLTCELSNIQQFLNINPIADVDIRVIVKKHPLLLAKRNKNHILKIMDHLKSFSIPSSSIAKCYEIFFLQPNEVLRRLKLMKENNSLNIYFNHSQFLHAILRYKTVMARLESMKKMPDRRTSLHFLIQHNDEIFVRQLRNGARRINSMEDYQYFADFFGKSVEQTILAMTQHPHAKHFSMKHIKHNIDHLIEAGFLKEDIFKVLYIAVYPKQKIIEALRRTDDADFVKEHYDVNVREFERARILKLCVIIMEDKYNFTGDGCWPDDELLDLEDTPDEEELSNIINKHKKTDGKHRRSGK